MLALSLVFSILMISTPSKAAVWTEANSWGPNSEARFSEWVRREWSVDFFARKTRNGQPNPYYGLRLDCADTVYSMRLIFAYENRLPFVVQDPTASGGTISNRMSRWDKQDQTARIRGFLMYIYDMMSTKSLPNDTYPIAVNTSTIRAGSLMLTTATNHHSWTVKEMMSIGVPHLIFNSTVGANSGSMLQERYSWPNPEWVFEGNYTPEGNAGFRYWRPAAYLNRPVWEVPGYSEEQYQLGLKSWVSKVQNRLATRAESADSLVNRLMYSVCQGFTGRVSDVKEGLQALANTQGCMSEGDYDTYSTPSRDQRIFDDMMVLRRAYRQIINRDGGSSLSSENARRLAKIFPYIGSSSSKEAQNMDRSPNDRNSVCVVEYLPGRSMDLAEFKRRMFLGNISNNPNDSGAYRWGENRGPSERAKNCPSWDNWKPVLD